MKDIKGYEGLYAVTSCGKVWSYRSNKFLKPKKTEKGILRISLYKDSRLKSYKIDKLVAEAYLDNPNNLQQVKHKDGKETHNWINNLEWCLTVYGDYSSNTAEKCRAGKKVQCVETGIIYKSMMEASRQTDISNSSISHTLTGLANTAGGYHWRYADE